MTDIEAKALFDDIQRAFVRKDLPGILKYYRSDIVYVGPAFSGPIIGIDAFKTALMRYFAGPERSYAVFKNIKAFDLSRETCLVHCLVEGSRLIYLSEQRYRGYLSRIFKIDKVDLPLIIYEHFSLLSS